MIFSEHLIDLTKTCECRGACILDLEKISLALWRIEGPQAAGKLHAARCRCYDVGLPALKDLFYLYFLNQLQRNLKVKVVHKANQA